MNKLTMYDCPYCTRSFTSAALRGHHWQIVHQPLGQGVAMSVPTQHICTGTALHFYDAGLGQRGSDKFYRAFYYEVSGGWSVLMHWGRDGTDGQAKVEHFTSEWDARKLVEKKLSEKVRHGYEVLGQGQAALRLNRQPTAIGAEFADAVAQRDPDKTRMSGGIVIHEEPDASDFKTDLRAAAASGGDLMNDLLNR